MTRHDLEQRIARAVLDVINKARKGSPMVFVGPDSSALDHHMRFAITMLRSTTIAFAYSQSQRMIEFAGGGSVRFVTPDQLAKLRGLKADVVTDHAVDLP